MVFLPDPTTPVKPANTEPSPLVKQLAFLLSAVVADCVRAQLERPPIDLVPDNAPDLPIPARKVRQLAKAGVFPATKQGRRWIFRRSDLIAHLTTSTAAPKVAPARAPDAVDTLAASLGLTIGGAP